jgi:hypothetical protein
VERWTAHVNAGQAMHCERAANWHFSGGDTSALLRGDCHKKNTVRMHTRAHTCASRNTLVLAPSATARAYTHRCFETMQRHPHAAPGMQQRQQRNIALMHTH